MFGKNSNGESNSQGGRSYVAETMQIEGDLHSAGAVDVAGLINGSVNVAEVMVFETGSIKGNLKLFEDYRHLLEDYPGKEAGSE